MHPPLTRVFGFLRSSVLGRWRAARLLARATLLGLGLGLGLGLFVAIGPAAAQDTPAAVAAEGAADEVAADAAVVAEDAVVLDPQLLQLRRYVRVNCGLARRVCDLSESEEQAFKQFDDAWVDKQIRASVAMPGVGAMVGILRFLGGAAADVPPGEVKLTTVKTRIDLAIDEVLTEEHRVEFQREREARTQFRKQALAALLVSTLDASLYLSPEQRTKLEPEVADWITTDLYWEFYLQNSSYLPDIPRQVLAKALTAEQLAVVQAAQKHNFERAQIENQMDQEPVMIER